MEDKMDDKKVISAKDMTPEELKAFRNSFDPDAQGADEEEGTHGN